MRLISSVDKRTNIKLNQDELTDMLNLYIEKAFASSFEHRKDAIHLIEKFPQSVPRKVHKLPRFSESEQRRRAAQSVAVRKMVIRYAIAADTQLDAYNEENKKASYDREYQRLFRNPVPGVELTNEEQAQLDASNKEVAFLFNSNTDWAAQAEQLAATIAIDPAQSGAFRLHYNIESDAPLTREDILNAWSRRRALIVMTRYRESVEVMNSVEQSSSTSLSPQELAVNFWKIKEASQLLAVLNNMIGNGRKRNMPATYTDAELAEIGDATRFENIAGTAICKFNLIANPMYSYLDIDALKDYNFNLNNGVGNTYRELLNDGPLSEGLDMAMPQIDTNELEKAVIKEFIAKHQDTHTAEEWHQFFYAPTIDENGKETEHPLGEGTIDSGFELFLSDYEFYYSNKIKPLSDKTDEYLKNFGLPVRYRSRYPGAPGEVIFFAEENTPRNLNLASSTDETDSDEFLAKGTPVAYQLSGRTVVLSQMENGQIGVDNLTYENSEALFNFGLKHQQEIFINQLHDADSMFVKSSPAFKDMKRSLEAVGNMQKLQPGQDVAEAEALFRKLLEDTEKYLIYKKDAGMLNEAGRNGEAVNDNDRSDYERKRLNVARKIRAFAKTKLKELELTRQAQVTLNSFTHMENGVRVLLDDQNREHLISRTDLSSRLQAQIRNIPADVQAQPVAEADELDRQYGHADAQVASFAQSHIASSIRNHRASGEAFSPEECKFVLSSALLYHALSREAAEHTAEAVGSLTDMLKHHPAIFTTLHQKLMQSTTIHAYMKCVDGMTISMPVMDILLGQAQSTPLDSVDLSTGVLTTDECTKMLTNEILDSMLRQERAANQTGRPGSLEAMLNSDRKHAEMIADCIKESSIMQEKISAVTVDGQVSFLAVAGLLAQMPATGNHLLNEKILNENVCCELLGNYMLDNMIELQRSKQAKSSDLEKMKTTDPLGYAQLRTKLADTAIVREVFHKGANVNNFIDDVEKRSLNELYTLFPQVQDARFCKAALDSARTALESENRRKNGENLLLQHPQKEMKL